MRLIIAFLCCLATVCATNDLMLSGLSIKYNKGTITILNQQKLPGEEEWITIESPEQMAEAISSLKVRGAPLLGIAAAFSLAQMAEQKAPAQAIETAAELLRKSRPTVFNLSNCIDRVLAAMKNDPDMHQAILKTAEEIFNEDITLCTAIGEAGAPLIQNGESILTYCNTGSLATAGIGTALGVIKTAHQQGKKIHVYVCETRPLLQGSRLTTWELEKNNIPYTLICDNMAATLMQNNKIDRVLVGANRIARNGDFANKVGTYSLAVLAHYHLIPFHVVAPSTTLDLSCPDGNAIKIEERSPQEVRGIKGDFGNITWSPKEAPVFNPIFDITPHRLVTSYILDKENLLAELIAPSQNIKAKLKRVTEELIETGRFLVKAKLCSPMSSNSSIRIDSNLLAITAYGKHEGESPILSGKNSGELTSEDIALVDLSGKPYNNSKQPTADIPLHLSLYAFFEKIGAVLHIHSPNAITLSRILGPEILFIVKEEEIDQTLKELQTSEKTIIVPIFTNHQGTAELAKEVSAYLQTHPETYGFLIRDHGFYTWGRDMKEIKNRVNAFEHLFDSELKMHTH